MMKKIPLDELEFGMYVNELDRPWTDTPFVFQGFFLKTPEQMEVLRRFCKHVLVDPDRVPESEAGRSTASMPMSGAARLTGTGAWIIRLARPSRPSLSVLGTSTPPRRKWSVQPSSR